MLLYNVRNNLISTLTGGLIFIKNDKWPNICKLLVFIVFFVLFLFPVVYYEKGLIYNSFFSIIIALIVFLVQSFVYKLNKMFDQAIDSPDQNSLETPSNLGFSLPPGISMQLWERRSVLFNYSIPMDQRAFMLIMEGFDPDSVFQLSEMIANGEITARTVLSEQIVPNRYQRVSLTGESFDIKFNRDSLSRTFDRPSSITFVILCVIFAFLSPLTCSWLDFNRNPYSNLLVAYVCSSAVFSLLHSPSCDPYSTVLNDPSIRFTRSFCLILSSIVCFSLDKAIE